MTIHNNLRPYFRLFAFLSCFTIGLAAFPAVSFAEMEAYPVVKLQSLDKVTARTMTFEVKVGSTIKFGPLYIRPRVCRKAPPIEKPESAAFLQIWELTPEEKAEWVFSGWMFASSPSLSSMDHPVYDVWVLDCLEETPDKEESGADESGSDTGSAESDAEGTDSKDAAAAQDDTAEQESTRSQATDDPVDEGDTETVTPAPLP